MRMSHRGKKIILLVGAYVPKENPMGLDGGRSRERVACTFLAHTLPKKVTAEMVEQIRSAIARLVPPGQIDQALQQEIEKAQQLLDAKHQEMLQAEQLKACQGLAVTLSLAAAALEDGMELGREEWREVEVAIDRLKRATRNQR